MYHNKHICTVCNRSFDQHADIGNPMAVYMACPGAVKFPVWPKTIKDETRAGLVYDKRVASFWKKSPGVFKPK